jgi:hypothetical protein
LIIAAVFILSKLFGPDTDGGLYKALSECGSANLQDLFGKDTRRIEFIGAGERFTGDEKCKSEVAGISFTYGQSIVVFDSKNICKVYEYRHTNIQLAEDYSGWNLDVDGDTSISVKSDRSGFLDVEPSTKLKSEILCK